MSQRRTTALAARARAMKKRNPRWSAADIAERIGMSRQNVERALASKGRPGRPGEDSVTMRLSKRLVAELKRAAKRDGVSARAWVEGLIVARLASKPCADSVPAKTAKTDSAAAIGARETP